MTGPAIRSFLRTKPLLPELRDRCGGVRLKTLNQPCPPMILNSSAVPRRFREGVFRLEVPSSRAGKKKAQPQEKGCAGMKSKLTSDGRNQDDDLVEP